jgi:DNA repair exonuclease SbcCD ATPase subunit
MEDFEPIDVEFVINSPEVKAESAKVKKEIEGVGDTAESVEKKVHQSIKRIAKDQDDVLKNLRGQTKRTLQDAMEAFQEMDPALRRNISQLVRYEAQLRKLRAAEKELQEDLKRNLITQGQYNKGLEGIRAESQRTVEAMKQLSKEVRDFGKEVEEVVVQTPELKFDKMDKSLMRVNRNMTAFTYSASMGLTGLANNLPTLVQEVINMDKATKELNAQGQKTPNVFRQIVSGILNWQTALIVGISVIAMYRKEIWEWIQGLFQAKKAIDETKLAKEAMNKAFESSSVKSAIGDILDLKSSVELAKQGVLDSKTVIDQYNESIGKASKEIKTLNEAEEGLTNNADRFIQATIFKAAALAAQEEIANELLELAKKQQEIEDELSKSPERIANASTFSAATAPGIGSPLFSQKQIEIQAEKDLQKEQEENIRLQKERIKTGSQLIENLKKQSLGTGFNLFGTDKKSVGASSVLKERENLLLKVAALDAEYARKSLAKDEEEVQALRDKFAKVRELVEKFNADPKNRAKRIDLGGLDAAEDRAMSDLLYRQETNRIKTNLEEQKKLYADFDKAVADFGIQEAERRFQGQLDTSMKYINLIRDEYEKLANLSPEEMTGGQQERLGFLSDLLQKEEDSQRKQMDELLKTLQDYNTKRELMIEQHLIRVEELRKNGNAGYIAEEERRHQEELNALDVAQIKKLEIFEEFFRGVDHLSTRNAKKLIEDVRETIKKLRKEFPNLISFFDDLEIQLGRTESKIGERIPRDLMELAQGFRRVSQEIRGANQGLSQMLGILSDNLARVSDIQRGMANFSAARQQGDGFGSVVAGAGVAGAVIGGIITLNSLMQQANQRQVDILKKQLEFQRQIYFGELEINRVIRERAVEQAVIDGNTLQTLIEQRKVLKANLDEIREDAKSIEDIFGRSISQSELDQLSLYDIRTKTFQAYFEKKMADLAESLYVDSTKTVKGGFFGLGKKEVEVFKSLAGKTFEEIEELFTKGQLTEEAAKLFQELKKLKEEGKQVEEQLKEIENQMRNIFTGGATAEGIAESIIQGFRQGKRAVEDFAEDVEELLRRAILNGFKYRFLGAPLNELLDQLFEDAQSGDGLTPEEIDRFTEAYNNITGKALDALKDLEAATGMTLSDPTAGPQRGLAGAIRREITEATASELAGLWRGTFDLSKRSLQVSEALLEAQRKHYDATLSIMQSSARIEANTGETVSALIDAVEELKIISRNTKGGNSTRGMGLDD